MKNKAKIIIKQPVFFIFFLGLLFFFIFYQQSFAATCSTSDPIVITEKKTMTFAQITAGFAGGTIDTNGNVTGDVLAYKGQIDKGQITIDACKNEIVNYSFIDGVLANGAHTMNVTVITSPGALTMPAAGKYTMDIDARLIVGSLQYPGDYAGSITVIVDY